jgi:hypothetical protein
VAPSGVDVCAALSDFYTAMKSAVIAGLKEVPVVGTLAEWAIELFEHVLGTVLDPLLAPVKAAIGALGVAAAVANILDPWTFYIDKEPFAVIDYGIEPNPGNAGSFTARIAGGAILEWPPALEACADLANVQLPDLDPNGAAVTWTTSFGPHATVTSQDDTIFDDQGEYVARLEYLTEVEPAEYATGALLSATITVSATVTRPPNQQLDAIVAQIVGNALSSLPADVAQILGSLAGSAIGSIVKFNDPSRTSSILVRYHAPPPPTTTSSTTTPPTTAAPPSCIGRVMQGQGQLQGITLELRPDGTWALDVSGYPPQNSQGVVVVLEGQLIGTWTPTSDGTGFVVVTDLNSPLTGTGTYEGVTLTLTLADLIGFFGLFGVSTSGGASTALCVDGNVTTASGEILFS